MRILGRYLLRQFFRIFFVCVLGVPLIFIVIDLTDNLDVYLADRSGTISEVALHYLYQFPYQSLIAFPIAALLASVFTVSTMARHSEITAAKGSGISFHRLTSPLILGSLLLSLVAVALTEVVPVTNHRAEQMIGQRQSRSQSLRIGFVYRGSEGRVYRIRRIDTRIGQANGIQIEREGIGFAYPTYNVSAATARWDTAAVHWVVEDGRLRFFPSLGQTLTFRFDELWQVDFTETPEELLGEPKEPEEMRYEELGRFIRALERSGSSARELRVERALRLAYPFAVFIIVLFGTPLANSSRRGGTPISIGIALATTILFMILIRISQALGAGGAITPTLAAWGPNLVFFAAGLILNLRVRT